MYIGPWQEYALSKVQAPRQSPLRQSQRSGGEIHGRGSQGGAEGDVEDLQAKVEYLQRLLKEQQNGSTAAPAEGTPSSSQRVQQRRARRGGPPRGKGVARGVSNSAVGYSRILAGLPRNEVGAAESYAAYFGEGGYGSGTGGKRHVDVAQGGGTAYGSGGYGSGAYGSGAYGRGGYGTPTTSATAETTKPPMSARSYNSEYSTGTRYSYTKSEPGGDSGGRMRGDVNKQYNASRSARKAAGGNYNRVLAARMLKLTRHQNGNDNIKNMFMQGKKREEPSRVEDRRGSVAMVKQMRNLYMGGGGGAEGEKPAGGSAVAAARNLQQQQSQQADGQQTQADPHAQPPIAAQPRAVADMQLTKQDFSQVSKYFGMSELELEEDDGSIERFPSSRVISPNGAGGVDGFVKNETRASSVVISGGSPGMMSPIRPSSRVGGSPISPPLTSPPMTPSVGANATVDELINWVGGLNVNELEES